MTGASVITGASVGAGVAGAQAEIASAKTVNMAKSRYSDFFFIFFLLLKYGGFGKGSLAKQIIQPIGNLNK
jgi:hypothetical protein